MARQGPNHPYLLNQIRRELALISRDLRVANHRQYTTVEMIAQLSERMEEHSRTLTGFFTIDHLRGVTLHLSLIHI